MASKKFYWDSCVFIDRISRTPDRISILEEITDAAAQGNIIIVASTLCIAETVRLQDAKDPPAVQSRLIFEFFENEWIELVQVDDFVAEKAHEIARDYAIKPYDAIHVATAIMRGVDTMQTYDGLRKKRAKGGLLKQDGQIGSPALSIKMPLALDKQTKLAFDAKAKGSKS